MLLSKIVLFKMPFGGSISLGKIVPLAILSHTQGIISGVFTSLLYSFVYLILNFKIYPTQNLISYILIIFLDYILPYILIGIIFGVKFSKKLNTKQNYYIRTTIFFVLKFFSSTLSGTLFFKNYLLYVNNIHIYSIIYNFMYIIPEYIITILILKKINLDSF